MLCGLSTTFYFPASVILSIVRLTKPANSQERFFPANIWGKVEQVRQSYLKKDTPRAAESIQLQATEKPLTSALAHHGTKALEMPSDRVESLCLPTLGCNKVFKSECANRTQFTLNLTFCVCLFVRFLPRSRSQRRHYCHRGVR